jgi:DNA-binding beta-propeller fold protein YncE
MLLALLFLHPVSAQTDGEYRVNWMTEYPGEKGDKQLNFGDRVSRIVFGKKPREVIKPFNVVAVDPEHYWILDQGAGGVFEVNKGRGSPIRTLKRAEQVYPSLVGICRTKEGNMLFTDSRLNQVMESRGDQLQVFGDSLLLDQPTGIACNHVSGDVWVVETGAHRICRYSSEGRLIEALGSRGTAPGLFNFPTFIWIDREGQVYVVDSMNHRIQIFNSEGVFLASFGELGDATGYMARPKGVATDSRGNIYVVDALFHVVQIFDPQGSFLYSFGSQGQGQGEFWIPTGLYIDDQDHIYVADSYNARVQIFKLEKND